jgi:hypothetical protein
LKLLLLSKSEDKIAYLNYQSPLGRKNLFHKLHQYILGGEQMKDSSFTYKEVFPKIRETIDHLYEQHQDFIAGDEISDGLLEDPEAREIIRDARRIKKSDNSLEWFAKNMIAHFSKWYTEAKKGKHDLFPDQEHFERRKIRGEWAYRPKRH